MAPLVYALCLLVFFFIVSPVEGGIPVFQYKQRVVRVLNCPLYAVNREDCDESSYRNTILAYMGPATFVAVIIALIVLIYGIGKYVFNGCGGRKQTPGFCCTANESPAKYDKGDLIRPFIMSFLVFYMCVASTVWGCVAASRLNASVNGLQATSVSNVIQIRRGINRLLDGTTLEVYNRSSDSMIQVSLLSIYPGSESIVEMIGDRPDDISRMMNSIIVSMAKRINEILPGVYVVLIVSLISSFVGLLFSLTSSRRYVSMLIFWIMALMSLLTWVGNGALSSTAFLLGDTCFEVNEYAQQRVNLVKILADCNETSLKNYTLGFKKVFDQHSKVVCEDIKPFCYDSSKTPSANVLDLTVFTCPSPINCSATTDTMLASWAKDYMYIAQDIIDDATAKGDAESKGYLCTNMTSGKSCNSKACSTECLKNDTLSVVGRFSKEFYTSVLSLVKARSTFDSTGQSLFYCDAVMGTVVPPMNEDCQGATKAAFNLMQSFGLLGLSLLIGMLTYAFGAKRFIPFDQVLTLQHN